MSNLLISQDKKFALPPDVITQTFAILAIRRVGKTYTASVMAEEMMKAGLPFVALDPTGAWWGLRASADGKTEGYPVVIIGGAHGDVPLDAGAGKLLADLVVDHPGWYVIDMSQTASNAEQDRIACDFADQLYRRKANNTFPLHLFVDEADSFAPQQAMPNQKRMLGAFEALVRRGGIRGIGTTLITQRPAVLNKNVLTQADNLIVLRVTSPQDRSAIDDWIKGHGSKEERETVMSSLASLQQGEAWFWSPGTLEMFRKIRIRERQTFNSSGTPKAGEIRVEPQRLAEVDLEALRKKLSATIEKAKADDPKLLRQRIAELETKLANAVAISDDWHINTAVERAVAETKQKLASLFSEKEKGYQERIALLRDRLRRIGELLAMPESDCPYDAAIDAKLSEAITAKPFTGNPATRRDTIKRMPAKPSAGTITAVAAVKGLPLKREHLTASQLRIMDSLGWWHSLGHEEPSRAQIAFVAGYTVNGHFNNLLGQLRQQELIDYPRGDCAGLTDEGLKLADYPPGVPTRRELHDRIRQKLSNSQQRLFDVLLAAKEPLTAEELAEQSGYTVNGHFNNLRGQLRTLQLCEYVSGRTVAAEWLFSI